MTGRRAQHIISTDLDWAKALEPWIAKDLVLRMGSADRPRDYYSKIHPPASSIDNAATTMATVGFIWQSGPGKPVLSDDLVWATTWSHGPSKGLVLRTGSADRPREYHCRRCPPAASIVTAATPMAPLGFIWQIGLGVPQRTDSMPSSAQTNLNSAIPTFNVQ